MCECQPLARILFEGLWCLADREGRFEWKPKKIKAMILPYDKCDIELLLKEIAKTGFILSYEVNGNRYGFIPTFLEHQSPHPNEKKSKIPEPSDSIKEFQVISGNANVPYMYKEGFNKEEYQDSKKRDLDKGGSGGNKKKDYAKFVLMTEKQYKQLTKKYGEEPTKKMIEKLNNYKGSSGKKYKSDYHAILSWVVDKILNKETQNGKRDSTQDKFSDDQSYPVDFEVFPDE